MLFFKKSRKNTLLACSDLELTDDAIKAFTYGFLSAPPAAKGWKTSWKCRKKWPKRPPKQQILIRFWQTCLFGTALVFYIESGSKMSTTHTTRWRSGKSAFNETTLTTLTTVHIGTSYKRAIGSRELLLFLGFTFWSKNGKIRHIFHIRCWFWRAVWPIFGDLNLIKKWQKRSFWGFLKVLRPMENLKNDPFWHFFGSKCKYRGV